MNKKRRVFIINSVYKFGSTGRICNDLAYEFNKEGIKTIVCYGRKKQPKDSQSFYFSNKFSVMFHAVMARIFDRDSYFSFGPTKKLIKYMNLNHNDVVILNNLHGYYINFNMLFRELKRVGCKVLFVAHDCWLFTGHCACFLNNNSECLRWKDGCFCCPLKKDYPASLVFDRSKKNYLNKKTTLESIDNFEIIVPSEWMSSNIKHSFLKNKKVYVINNGVDINVFKKVNNEKKSNLIDQNKKNILCISNIWTTLKGIEDVYNLSTLIEKNEHIIVVGKVKNKLISDKITYIDQTSSQEELAKIYSSVDVLFNPTHFDNYPTINLEALSCGCPVVTYNCGGAGEAIDKAFVVEKNVNQAYLLIRDLLYNKKDYKFQNAKLYSKKLMYSKYRKLITEDDL